MRKASMTAAYLPTHFWTMFSLTITRGMCYPSKVHYLALKLANIAQALGGGCPQRTGAFINGESSRDSSHETRMGAGICARQVYTQHAYMRPYGVSTMLPLGIAFKPPSPPRMIHANQVVKDALVGESSLVTWGGAKGPDAGVSMS